MKRLFRFITRSRADIASDVSDEFAFHLDMRVEDLMREGLTESAARAQAMREFGNVERGAAACVEVGAYMERQRWMTRLASELRQDLSYGGRFLARSPGFSVVAVLTLALAIGANTTIFSLVSALALKPMPAANPAQLVRIYSGQSQTSWLNYQDLRERSSVFTDVAAHANTLLPLIDGDTVVRMIGETASANYLAMIGVPAAIGRTFVPSDSRVDIIVLSEHAWRTRFGRDPAIVGRRLRLGGRSFEVVGVMPKGFRGARPPGFVAEFWIPIDPALSARTLQDRTRTAYEIVGRLKPEVEIVQAQAATAVIAQQIRVEHPALDESFARTEVFPVDGVLGFRGVASTLAPVFAFVGVLTIVAGFVLLVGCANIAGLLLGRATVRRREIGVRLALGATRGRLVRQLLSETLLLALAGGGAGIVLALWLGGAFNALAALLPVPVEFDLALDRRMLIYALVLSIATALLCGLAPARRATRLDVVSALKEDAPAPRRQRLRQALVVGQVAISCVLLLCGGLFLRSLASAHRVNPGFDPAGVVLVDLALDEDAARSGDILPFLDRLQSGIRQIPGVTSSSLSTVVPLTLMGREEYYVRTEADSPTERGRYVMANRIAPGYFATLRIPLIAGRDFTASDRAGSPRVAIVNETLARRFWNGNTLGMRLDDVEVVGVVGDSKYWTLGETIAPTVYTPFAQRPLPSVNVLVRAQDVAAATRSIRSELARLDPNLSADIKSMSGAVGNALLPARVGAATTTAFGTLGALLTMMGIYGLVAFTVAQRTREIGIRKAIGARAPDIFALVLRGTLVPVGTGLLIGLAVGALAAIALGGFIVGVSPLDPVSIAGTSVLVLGTALAASALPALRAMRIESIAVMKQEW